MLSVSFFNIDNNLKVKHCPSNAVENSHEYKSYCPNSHDIKHVIKYWSQIISSSDVLIIYRLPHEEVPRENILHKERSVFWNLKVEVLESLAKIHCRGWHINHHHWKKVHKLDDMKSTPGNHHRVTCY